MTTEDLDYLVTIKIPYAEFILVVRSISFCHNYYDSCACDLEAVLTDDQRKHFEKLSFVYDVLLDKFKRSYKGRITWKEVLGDLEVKDK